MDNWINLICSSKRLIILRGMENKMHSIAMVKLFLCCDYYHTCTCLNCKATYPLFHKPFLDHTVFPQWSSQFSLRPSRIIRILGQLVLYKSSLIILYQSLQMLSGRRWSVLCASRCRKVLNCSEGKFSLMRQDWLSNWMNVNFSMWSPSTHILKKTIVT